MKRIARVLAGVTAAMAFAVVPSAAQAAGSAASAQEWTLHFDGVGPTLSPMDEESYWSGKCPVPGESFEFALDGVDGGVGGSTRGECSGDGTYHVEVMHYGYNRDDNDRRITSGQTYLASFYAQTTGGQAMTVIE